MKTTNTVKALGFRAEPNAINWAVVEGSCEVPVLVGADQAAAPLAFDEAAALAWFREHVRGLIETYSPTVVGIRYPETFGSHAGNASAHRRCRVEGVIAEAAASKGVTVRTGSLVTISKNLGPKAAKKYLESEEFRGVDWAKYSKNRREAILVAASALPEEED